MAFRPVCARHSGSTAGRLTTWRVAKPIDGDALLEGSSPPTPCHGERVLPYGAIGRHGYALYQFTWLARIGHRCMATPRTSRSCSSTDQRAQ